VSLRPTTEQEAELYAAAKAAMQLAHAPYSNFLVGAALLSATGRIYAGCNIENASYGATICAERNAISGAVMAADKELIAVLVITATEYPTFPCGMCRQVLAEFNPAMLVISTTVDGGRAEQSLSTLLPSNFSQHDLEAASALKR
jgi:cytidine deaminase